MVRRTSAAAVMVLNEASLPPMSVAEQPVGVGLQQLPHIPVTPGVAGAERGDGCAQGPREARPDIGGIRLELAGDSLGAASKVSQPMRGLEGDQALAGDRHPAAGLGVGGGGEEGEGEPRQKHSQKHAVGIPWPPRSVNGSRGIRAAVHTGGGGGMVDPPTAPRGSR